MYFPLASVVGRLVLGKNTPLLPQRTKPKTIKKLGFCILIFNANKSSQFGRLTYHNLSNSHFFHLALFCFRLKLNLFSLPMASKKKMMAFKIYFSNCYSCNLSFRESTFYKLSKNSA